MELRPYQTRCVDSIEAGFRKTDRGLIALPTGCGKTVIFAHLVHKWLEEGRLECRRPAIIIAHREELLQQAEQKLHAMDDWMRVGLERASARAPGDCQVIIASIQTIGSANSQRLSDRTPGLVIVDEAHHAAAATYIRALGKWPGAKVLGCTATPKRFDRQAVHTHKDAVFSEIFYEYSIRAAIKDGWLCPLRGYRVITDLSLDTVATVGGDFNERQLAALVDQGPRTSAAFRRWEELAADRQTLVFCVTVDHAVHAAAIWQQAGYSAEVVHGGMSIDQRNLLMGRFRSGQLQILCNCAIATEGFDVPAVSSIVMLRPTKSWGLYVQMTGRGTRLAPGKADCLILDVVDNTSKHELCTVPSILDLPPKLDLNGATLEEAALALGRVTGSKVKALQTAQPRTLQEVESLLVPVELLERTAEIRKSQSLAWTACQDGRWALSVSSGVSMYIVPDRDNSWHIESKEVGGRSLVGGHGSTMEQAMARAERWADKNYPQHAALTKANARWRKSAASSAQKQRLKSFGWRLDILPDIDKGLASDLLNQEFANRRG